jgi:hypothetical protein
MCVLQVSVHRNRELLQISVTAVSNRLGSQNFLALYPYQELAEGVMLKLIAGVCGINMLAIQEGTFNSLH